MTPRERVFAALQHRIPDRVPRFEIWIDALLDELGQADPVSAYANLGQDCIMLPTHTPSTSNAWRNGVDEFGRVWRSGTFVDGVIECIDDIEHFSPPLTDASQYFDAEECRAIRRTYPDHGLIFGTHIGPFTAGYMAMGFGRFFTRLVDDPAFVHRLLEHRTDWCIAIYQTAIRHGAEVVVLGDDAGQKGGPMLSPRMWREHILPYHRRIVKALKAPALDAKGLKAPVIWHSDGDITSLLPMAVEAGFTGIHGLDPLAGMDLAAVKRDFGRDLVLIGNIDVRALFSTDLQAVRDEVDRCVSQGAPGGGYMLATCNSIFAGMHPAAVAELFRYENEVGFY